MIDGGIMCLVVFGNLNHPQLSFFLAGNRDEFFDRPSAAADYWDDASGVLAGRDLKCHGSWLGISGDRRLALVTNVRVGMPTSTHAISRGRLAAEYLVGSHEPPEFFEHCRTWDCGPYNLILGDRGRLFWGSNHPETQWKEIADGLHGLSNGALNTPWPKVRRAQGACEHLLEGGRIPDPEAVRQTFRDTRIAPDEELPGTGVPLAWERSLSAIFVKTPHYGTRSTSLMLASHDGRLRFWEWNYDPTECVQHTRSHEVDWTSGMPWA